jgi:hypothetical protein
MIGQFQFAELQAISYAITREKAPIYTMGSADPRAYSRNKRGIAGNLIWINFDRNALLNLFHFATAAMRPTGTGTVRHSRPRRPRRTRRSPRRSFARTVCRCGHQVSSSFRHQTLARTREQDPRSMTDD